MSKICCHTQSFRGSYNGAVLHVWICTYKKCLIYFERKQGAGVFNCHDAVLQPCIPQGLILENPFPVETDAQSCHIHATLYGWNYSKLYGIINIENCRFSDMPRVQSDAKAFLDCGIDVMNVGEFLRGFMAKKVEHQPQLLPLITSGIYFCSVV